MSKNKKFNYEPFIHILSILIVILFIINLFFVSSLTSSLKQKIDQANEAARPAMIQLMIINPDNCKDCFDINKVVDDIKTKNVNVTREETLDFKKASDFIKTYNIKKLPAVIVTGELDKSGLNTTLTSVDDALVFTNSPAPYYDTDMNKINGLVTATIINPDNCKDCKDISLLVDEIKASGVIVQTFNKASEKDSKDIINKYNIKKIPALILSSDAAEYPIIKQNWKILGTEESDGTFILRNALPPYKNLETGKVEGLVDLTNVVDSSCNDCYNVSLHRQIIDGYSMKIAKEVTYDASTPEGFAYAQKNNITLVPTIVLSNDAKVYTGFYNVFGQVSKEFNGNLIFTSLDLVGKYKNLETGQVIEPQQQG